MTNLLRQAVEAVSRLPPENQEKIARLMLMLAGEGATEDVDPQHLADVMEGLAQARRGEFATDAEVAAAFRLFGA